MKHLFLSLLSLMVMSPATGAVELAEIFGDHMVLQREKPVPIWGTGQPDESVTVSFCGQSKSTIANENGRWKITLDQLTTSSEPGTLTVSGANEIQLKDVLVGEVWLASGQSNMFWPLGNISSKRGKWPGVKDGEAEVKNARFPLIRLNSQLDHEFGIGGWKVCSPETARGFSAVAYFFGRELNQQLDVPIGIIARSFGGTTLQAWTPQPELLGIPFVRRHADLYPKIKPQVLEWNIRFREYRAEVLKGTKPKPQRPDMLPEQVELAKRLQAQGNLHRRYIEPLVPYAMRGFIWYQGESQTIFKSLTIAMEDMLAALIKGRRRLWNDETLPFYFVQFPIYDHPTKGTHWHIAREVLRRVHTRVPRTGMAVTYDFSDRSNVHPPEKQEVGRRLALWALAKTYNRDIVFSGPLFDRATYHENRVRVSFLHGKGLKSSDGGPLRGFEVADNEGVFHKATATIDGSAVVVQSPNVANPQHVRFFFGGYDRPNLSNGAGLPGSPFTTADLR